MKIAVPGRESCIALAEISLIWPGISAKHSLHSLMSIIVSRSVAQLVLNVKG